MSFAITPPFPVYTALDGDPLDNGKIYVGTANLDPVANPVQLYWDEALTITATQPIRTSGGYPVRNGTPTNFFAAVGNVSITVKDAVDVVVYTELNFSGTDSFVQAGTGAVVRTMQNKARERFDLRDFGVIRRQSTSNEYTATIQNALNQAQAEGITAVYCEESYNVAGTLTQPAGVAIVSSSGTSRWFEGSPANEPIPPGFYKPSTGTNGALLIRGVGAHLVGITLDHQKIGGATEALGGIMQMGPTGDVNFNNTLTMNCTLRGHEINEATGLRRATPDCHMVVFPASIVGFQRYWHNFTNIYLQNGRVGFKLNNQSNACTFNGVRVRDVYRPIWLNGGAGETIENSFDGSWTQNYPLPTTTQTAATVAALPYNDRNIAAADVAVITMEGTCQLNRFSGPTEMGGRQWILSSSGANSFNDASGLITNEAFPSAQPPAWMLPTNDFNARSRWGGFTETYLPYDTADDNASQGWGDRVTLDRVMTTSLPTATGVAGPPTTGAASRIITKWSASPLIVAKAAKPNLRFKTRIVAGDGAAAGGSHEVEIEWAYRVSNGSTAAGALSVISVRSFPAAGNIIVGVHFIKGITGTPRPFAIAVTLGVSGFTPYFVQVSHDGLGTSSDTIKRPMAEYGRIDTTPTALTADDVTDAVDMLTVAVTAV